MSSSTTPQAASSAKRSTSGSRSRRPISRPTTPLRPSSRSSLRESGKASVGGASDTPLESFEPAFAELSDSMADLEANFMHLQLMHESLARFSENFASFLYGLNMNAFCVDFPEVSFSKAHKITAIDDIVRRLFQIHFAGLESKKSSWVDQQIQRDFTVRLMERQRSCKP
jgi:DASH complex subunit DAM1